jgi:hypothetical protein
MGFDTHILPARSRSPNFDAAHAAIAASFNPKNVIPPKFVHTT